MKLRFEIESDPDEKTPAYETLYVDGSVTECAAGCVRLIGLIYFRAARHNKTVAESFRQMVITALVHPDSPAFESNAGKVGTGIDISAVFPKPKHKKE